MKQNRKIISFSTYRACKNIKIKVRSSMRFSCNKCKNKIICGYKNSGEIKRQFEFLSNKVDDKNDIEIIISCKNYKNKIKC